MKITGVVTDLFLKPAKGAAMAVPFAGAFTTKAGYGIRGDQNAHPMSPRQVLITRAEDLEFFNLKPGDLRENIVIAGLNSTIFQPGSILHVGHEVSIRLTFNCEPCKRIGHLVSLHDISKKRGILGVILRGGPVAVEQLVSGEAGQFPPLSDVPYDRFLAFVSQIPYGRVVTYREVLTGMGVAESYARAIPNYMRHASSVDRPFHRILDSQGALITNHIPGQAEKLAQEGVEITPSLDLFGNIVNQLIDLNKYLWHEALYIV